MNPKSILPLIAIPVAGVLLSSSLSAALLVYDGYDYTGSVGDGSSMDGVTSNATGLSGDYNLTQSTGASTTYQETGLSFGSNFLSNSGGGIYLDGGSSFSVLEIGLNMDSSPVTGTLYSSYLGQLTSMTTGGEGIFTSRIAFDTGASNTTTRRFNSELDGRVVSRPAVGYGEATTAAVSGTPSLDVTYLVLARFTNVGGAGGGTADQFVFTLADYDSWFAAGGLEGDLGTYATITSSNTLGNTKGFSNDYRVEIGIAPLGGTGSEEAYFDELRYGTTLADVVAVPEPSAFALMLGLFSGAVFVTRRRRG